MSKIYVASSWRNTDYPAVVKALLRAGHEVYDFREGNGNFHWKFIDPQWRNWTPKQFAEGLTHQVAKDGFECDYAALEWADTCVLVLPCGRSAHLEACYMAGSGKQTVIYMPELAEAELMYKLLGPIVFSRRNLVAYLGDNIGKASS